MPDSRDRLRMAGQANLGVWVTAACQKELWTVQDKVLTALSQVRSQVVVPSCNASGKTWLAARATLAFYDSYTPGTPCRQCDPTGTKGGCRGSKVLTTSSKETHLKDNLWGEIRLAVSELTEQGLVIPGYLPPSDTFIEDNPGNHIVRGQVATKEESFQGYHAAHKLIVGDEATSVSEDVAKGIMSLQATADTRLLLIFNPTTSDTYAAQMARSPDSEVIKIRAYDTPHFTGEHVPEGSNLVTPLFLERMKSNGEGPGSYMWTTRVLAEFWDQGDDLLIPPGWVHAAKAREPMILGTVGMGIDLAPYGNAEQVIGMRRGDNLVDLKAYPSGRTDFFINGDPDSGVLSPVRRMIRDYGPHVIVYDADGVGSGAIGDFTRLHDWAIKSRFMLPDSQIIGFRGGKKISDFYTNARTGWWWALRKRFERGNISMMVQDPKLDTQLSQIRYGYTQAGLIRVETKDEMRKRGLESPDRADAIMYCFAFSESLPDPGAATQSDFVVSGGYVTDHSEEAHWERALDPRRKPQGSINAVTGIRDDGLD